MAITKLMNIKGQPRGKSRHLYNAIKYILNPEKTENGLLVGGNSGTEAEEIYRVMMNTKKEWEKLDGRQGYHFVISWEQGETDAQTAVQVVQEFCKEYFEDDFDYVFSVHTDHGHMHGHIVFNSVNRMSGYKYRYNKGDWEKNIQPITDKLCEKHGLKKLTWKEKRTGKSYAEWQAEKNGKPVWKQVIKLDIDFAINNSRSYLDFIEEMRELGYKLSFGMSKKHGEYISLLAQGQSRAWRSYNLGTGYAVENIKTRIQRPAFDYGGVGVSRGRTPILQKCRVGNAVSLSRYQVKKVTSLYYVQRRVVAKNPYAVSPTKIRKQLIHIDELREECVYLLRRNVRGISELQERMELLKQEKNALINQQRTYEDMQSSDASFGEYDALLQKLQSSELPDEQYEELSEQIEKLEVELPSGIYNLTAEYRERQGKIESVKKEIKVIRRLLKEDKELYKAAMTMKEPVRQHEKKGEGVDKSWQRI